MKCTYWSPESGETLEVDTYDVSYPTIWQRIGLSREQQQAAQRTIALYTPQIGMHDDPRRNYNRSFQRQTLEKTAQDPFTIDRIIWSGVLMLHPRWKRLILKPDDTPLEERIQRTGNGTNHLKDPKALYQVDPFTAYCLETGEERKKKDFLLQIPERVIRIKERHCPVP